MEKFHEIYANNALTPNGMSRTIGLTPVEVSATIKQSGAVVNRDILRSGWKALESFTSDQSRGIPMPPVQPGHSGELIPLARSGTYAVTLQDAVSGRASRRSFLPDPLSLEELSWLVRSVAGVRKTVQRQGGGTVTLRAVPSAGARHPLDTLLAVFRVNGLAPGLYRYMPLDDALAFEGVVPTPDEMTAACLGQEFCGNSSVVFIWTAIPYRTEWRYGPVSTKLVALDAGHACENLYLAVEAVNAGTCAIGAYDQELADAMCSLDGTDEFVVYMAPVGKVNRAEN